jgi:outer membrane protein assembly factor BamE (lipoprotein component of BamABCDE complex)
MKQKTIFALVILCAVISFVSCKKNGKTDQESSTKPNREVEIDHNNINYVNTKDLYVGMPRKDIEEKFGEPIDSLGSGVSILVYMKDEENMLVLYFDPHDNLSKVESIDQEDNSKIILE